MENVNTELTPSETAYFESGGNTEIEVTSPEPEKPTPEALNEQVEQSGQPQERDERGKFVPHQALHQERENHKQTKAQLEEISRKQAVLEDRWNTLLKIQEPKQAEDNSPPDPEQDIFAYSKWQAEQLKQLQERVDGRDKQEHQQREQSAQEAAIWSHWSVSAQEYATENPQFNDAAMFLAEARDKQLSALAWSDDRFADKAFRDQVMNSELKDIIKTAKAKGINPAQAVFDVATNGYGFTAQAKDPGNLSLPDSLAKIAEGQNGARSLSSSNGKSSPDPESPEAIASMSQQDFDAWLKNPANEKRFNSIMRGQ